MNEGEFPISQVIRRASCDIQKLLRQRRVLIGPFRIPPRIATVLGFIVNLSLSQPRCAASEHAYGGSNTIGVVGIRLVLGIFRHRLDIVPGTDIGLLHHAPNARAIW